MALGYVLAGTIVLCVAVSVEAHGSLMVPPQRSSIWREDPKNPNLAHNYDDTALFCGGFQRQWNQNGGKCGACGDAFDGPWHNEAGGKYASGVIGRTYEAGAIIDADVLVSANHIGWFEYRLCPHNNPAVRVQQSCLDRYLLQVEDHDMLWKTRFHPERRTGHIKMRLKLPAGVTCTQCVLQWKYHTGNSWGCDDNNNCCSGCGPQEEFVNCADIAIEGVGGLDQTVASQAEITTHANVAPVEEPNDNVWDWEEPDDNVWDWEEPDDNVWDWDWKTPIADDDTASYGTDNETDISVTSNVPGRGCMDDYLPECVSVHKDIGLLNLWCKQYCWAGTCDHPPCNCWCQKSLVCDGYGNFKTEPGIKDFCQSQCGAGQFACPRDKCTCF